MSSRPTLVFLCEQPELYTTFIAEFSSAGFQMLLARNLSQAKSLLLTHQVYGLLLRHDSAADDRSLAPRLKRIAARVPVFMVTDQPQSSPQANIDAIWRGEFTDPVVARGMAVFFRHYITQHMADRSLSVMSAGTLPFAGMQTRPGPMAG